MCTCTCPRSHYIPLVLTQPLQSPFQRMQTEAAKAIIKELLETKGDLNIKVLTVNGLVDGVLAGMSLDPGTDTLDGYTRV